MSKAEPRVVVRRKKLHHEAPHGGSWKIAYADFMTAMMAFFLVMWLLSLIPVHELTLVAEYFRKPLVEAIRSQNENRPIGTDSVIPGGAPSIIPNFQLAPRNPFDSGDIQDIERLENLKQDLEQLIEHDPVMSEYRPQMLLDMTPDGLRVQILDRENRPMFDTGSAQLQRQMRVILRQLGPLLNNMPNSISITGHTDARRYATGEREYSNWELSADRANAARRELVAGGMDETKVRRVLGLSSTVNLVDDPYADANRRISILVLNQRAERRMDEQEATYASQVELDEVLGADAAKRLGVEQGSPQDSRSPPGSAIPGWPAPGSGIPGMPDEAAPGGGASGLLMPGMEVPVLPMSAPQGLGRGGNPQYDAPLLPRPGTDLVETVILPLSVADEPGATVGRIGNIR
ncbi:flagellar motor protein MotB [Alcaligenaceae bacterium]|nr:flagellar motor protein MotB [Alcaligenaceae bacterium]